MGYTSDSVGEELFLSRLADRTQQATSRWQPVFLGFLNDRQQALCRQRLPYGDTSFRLFGGYEDAERCYLGITPLDRIADGEFPIRCVEITYRTQDTLTHRDFLGAILGLNLERETVGDILITPGRALVYLSAPVADTVLRELDQVGRVGVRCAEAAGEAPDLPRSYQPVEGFVSSLRLDCVVALLAHCSRKEAAQQIAQKLVTVDGAVREGSRDVAPGEKISIRGLGKFLFDTQLGVSKKDRLRVRFQKYV